MITETNYQVNYTSAVPLKTCHERLGHVYRNSIVKMLKNDVVSGLSVQNMSEYFCETCLLGKQSKLSFKTSVKTVNSLKC